MVKTDAAFQLFGLATVDTLNPQPLCSGLALPNVLCAVSQNVHRVDMDLDVTIPVSALGPCVTR